MCLWQTAATEDTVQDSAVCFVVNDKGFVVGFSIDPTTSNPSRLKKGFLRSLPCRRRPFLQPASSSVVVGVPASLSLGSGGITQDAFHFRGRKVKRGDQSLRWVFIVNWRADLAEALPPLQVIPLPIPGCLAVEFNEAAGYTVSHAACGRSRN